MPKRTTLADVARLAGVSPATVSFVLTDRPNSRISPATADRVRAAAAELGYTVDKTARGLRTGRSDAISFISDEVMLTRYASAIIRGILNVAHENEYAVLMAETDHEPRRTEEAVRVMRSRRVDGLALGMMRSRQIDLPAGIGSLPVVIVNGYAPEVPCILPDEYQAGLDAVNHLVTNGHRRIALIGRSPEHLDPRVSVTIGRRMDGIGAGMAAAGIGFVHEVPGREWDPELGYRGASEILDNHDVTAIIAANDRVAFGAYQAAGERGIAVGRDISVISFDDELLATYLRPQVTTLRLPYLEMGEIGARRLLDLIGAPERPTSDPASLETFVPMPLIERGSVATLSRN